LFPAPIGRRELLLYHVVGGVYTLFFSAVWMTVFTFRFAPQWYGGFAGVFFGFGFLQLTTQLVSLALSTISVGVARRARRLTLFSLVVLLVAGLLVTRANLPESNLSDTVSALVASPLVVVLSSPARVFVELFTSETPASFAMWLGGAVGILAVLFVLLAVVDVAYTEAAVRVSREVQDRLKRMQAGGAGGSGTARVATSLPGFAWLGGAGPIMWQKCTDARRGWKRLLWNSVFLVGFALFFVAMVGRDQNEAGTAFGGHAGWVVVFMMMLMNQNFRLDFRSDLDRMAYLKSLPLRPGMVALGQTLPTAVLFTLIQLVAVLVIQFVAGVETVWLPVLLLVLFPLNWLAAALDNVLFLWMPYRIAPKESGQMQFMGRMMVVLFTKSMIVLVACGFTALVGWAAWAISGAALIVGLASALVLGVMGAVVTRLAGRLFATFDSTKDVPA